jgi:hypothetical protein
MANWRRLDWANSSWREGAVPRFIRVSSRGWPSRAVSPCTRSGHSQPGATANTLAVGNNAQLKIEINGTGMPGVSNLFVIQVGGSGTTFGGLVVTHIPGPSVYINGNNSNAIAGNKAVGCRWRTWDW